MPSNAGFGADPDFIRLMEEMRKKEEKREADWRDKERADRARQQELDDEVKRLRMERTLGSSSKGESSDMEEMFRQMASGQAQPTSMAEKTTQVIEKLASKGENKRPGSTIKITPKIEWPTYGDKGPGGREV